MAEQRTSLHKSRPVPAGNDARSDVGVAAACTFVLWFLFSGAYILFRTNQFTAVDGALNCLTVYWRRPPYLDGNNHLLYPVNVWLWSHFVSLLGFHAGDPIAFLHTIAAMNAVCAAGSVALVNLIVWRFTRAWKLSLITAVGYGLSWALLVHATNSAQPMVGLFVSLLATLLVVEGLARERPGLLFVGGVLLALALANYESMFLVAPLLYLACLVWSIRRVSPERLLYESSGPSEWFSEPRIRVLRLVSSALGTLVGVVAIYGIAYYSVGIRKPDEMLHALTQMGGAPEVYSGFSFSRFANLPIGFVLNIAAVLPSDYQGLRWLLFRQHNGLSIVGLVGLSGVAAFGLVLLARTGIRIARARGATHVVFALFGVLCVEVFPLVYWGPVYDKLWLQPLALAFILSGVMASKMDLGSARWLSIVALVLIGLEAGVNLPRVVSARTRPTRCLEDARKVAALVAPTDKVVADFDPVSTLWMGLFDVQPARTLLFPATSPAASLQTLEGWRNECAASGCRIIFVALLDQSKEVWDAFLGDRLKVPYGALDRYRNGSRSIDQFACEGVGLHVYEPARN